MNDEHEQLVNKIQKSFLNLLKNYLPKEILEKAKKGNNVKIISIGCGRFREAKSIYDYFAHKENLIKLFGIEIDNTLLELAKNEPIIKKHKDSVILKLADATNIENYKDLIHDGFFDLIIVRHPEITFNSETFIKVFSFVTNIIAKNGYLFITTHFEDEKESLKLLLKLLRLDLVTDIENKDSPSFKKNGNLSHVDKYLLIAKVATAP